MKGDFTRDTFDASRHYTRVLMQQGRVQLDADWNEQAAILLHYLQALAGDLIGPHGGPADITRTVEQNELLLKVNCGFEIIATEDRIRGLPESDEKIDELISLLQESEPRLLIGKGHYYVDGILCENNGYLSFDAQPGYPWSAEEEEELGGSYLVYLDVWERHLTYLEMEDSDGSVVSIRESALGPGGPDTATRTQLVWQVKFTDKIGEINIPSSLPPNSSGTWRDWVDEKWLEQGRMVQRQLANHGKLKASAIQLDSAPDEACIISPESHYRGTENQLYRVEIHNEGTAADGATFKWSRENGSVIFPIREINTDSVTLYSLGRDERFGLKPGDWVEIVDDNYTLRYLSESLLQVETINYDEFIVTFKGTTAGTISRDVAKHALLRRWDQHVEDGVLDVTESATEWIDLEDGIQIQFQPHGTYYTGDYWLIPARTATGDVEWPGPVGEPVALEPRGVKHHYAPLWIISADGGSITADSTNDLRRYFKQLWMLG